MIPGLITFFGLVGIFRGEFQLTRNRRIVSPHGRIAGSILIIGAFLGFQTGGWVFPWIGLVLAIIYGFATTKTTEKLKSQELPDTEE